MPEAKCVQDCYDGTRMRRFFRGEIIDLDPKDDVAKYFEFIEDPLPIVEEDPEEEDDD